MSLKEMLRKRPQKASNRDLACRNAHDAARLQLQRDELIVGVQNAPGLHGIEALSSSADIDFKPFLGRTWPASFHRPGSSSQF